MIERQVLADLIARNFTQREIAAASGHSQASVKYWLKSYGLKTVYGPHGRWIDGAEHLADHQCRVCGKSLVSIRQNKCMACYVRVRRMRMKLKAIELKGGCCQRCGWNGIPAGFEFHHIKGQKDFNIGQVSNKSWEVIKKELEKCELLCRNCHAIEHCKHDDERLLAEIKRYNGGRPLS